ncbi:MAG: 6-phosphogluconolactonase [Rubripirellula sp.]
MSGIEPYENVGDLHQATAAAFCELVAETLATKDTFRISLSGGSTPKRLYELLAERELPWDKIHWYWGDERNVLHDHADSNAKMVQEALLSRVPAPPANVHPVPVDVEDPASAALAYEKLLREHFAGQEFPQWDLALLGMGDDAHTASLFPETKALDATDRWFTENWVEKFDCFRYTLTAPAINSARQSWFLVAGSGKQDALKQVLSNEHNPRLYPSQLIQPTRWYVTQDAMA